MRKGSLACYNGHEIRFITVMLQSCPSYTSIESITNTGQSVVINNSLVFTLACLRDPFYYCYV